MKTKLNKMFQLMLLLGLAGFSTGAWALGSVPTLTSCVPNIDITSGGNTVEITGNFFLGTTGVTFAGNAGTGLVINSATSLSVVVPVSTAVPPTGLALIVVTNATGPSVTVLDLTYTRSNKTLQVSVRMTMAKNVAISWAAGTTNDDTPTAHGAGDITPYVWIVADDEYFPGSRQVNINSPYSTAIVPNAHTMTISNNSATGTNLQINGIASDSVPTVVGGGATNWAVAAAAAPDTYSITGALSGGAGTLPLNSLQTLFASLAPAGTTSLTLVVSTPTTALSTSVAVGVNAVLQTVTVSLIAVGL